jgi:hypothetical protein
MRTHTKQNNTILPAAGTSTLLWAGPCTTATRQRRPHAHRKDMQHHTKRPSTTPTRGGAFGKQFESRRKSPASIRFTTSQAKSAIGKYNNFSKK